MHSASPCTCRSLLRSHSSLSKIFTRTARSGRPPRTLSIKNIVNASASEESIPAGASWRFLRATGFCVSVSGAAFVGCAIWNYESVRKTLRARLADLLPSLPKQGEWRNKVESFWGQLQDGRRLVVYLIILNCAVFALWQFRSLHAVMSRFFLSDPRAKNLALPLLNSMFSHIAPIHLICNMYVLWSFADPCVHIFGKEQFLFFYISAGLFSGLASLGHKLLRGIPQPSLGASGAIIAALAAVCTAYPDSRLSVIFLPMYTFSAGSALKFLTALETLGILLKWRFFDHVAHLSGILFGIWYVKYGHQLTWSNRESVVNFWHKMRSKSD